MEESSPSIEIKSLFGISEDFSSQFLSLDDRFVPHKTSTFFCLAQGHSMEPLIHSGDVIAIDRSIEDFHGRVCVIAYQGELLCKRVFKTRQGLLLKCEAEGYQDILVRDNAHLRLWGVVVSRHGDVF